MKTAAQLKKIIDLFYYTLVLWLFVAVSAFVYYTFIREDVPMTTVSKETITDPMWLDTVWTAILIFQFGMFLWGVYHLRKSAHQMVTGNYFPSIVSMHFKKAGNIFISLGIICLMNHFTSLLYFSSLIYIGVDSQIVLYAFIIVIGLFFKLFSIAFAEAKQLKEENTLTI
ncbi:MAG: hypothetical protein ACI828_001004 [Flavobacteriales bacterium]|jgi:hypothetical protein